MTLTTEPAIIMATPEQIHAHPLNRKPPGAHVRELAKSIKTKGQIVPAIGRKHPDKKDAYEIVAGNCRAEACKKLGLTLRVEVHPLTDEEAREFVATENFQRQDLDPIEEAKLLKAIIEEGSSPKTFAATLGKSEAWLKSRMRLANLTKDALELALEDGWTIDMLEVLGDLPQSQQEEYAGKYVRGVDNLKAIINSGGIPLDDVPWLDDPRSAIEGCSGQCSKSSADMLFDFGDNKIRCMNRACFKARQTAYILARINEMVELHGPDRVFVSNVGGNLETKAKILKFGTTKKDLGKKVQEDKINENTCYLMAFDVDKNDFEIWPFAPAKAKKGDKATTTTASDPNIKKPKLDWRLVLRGKRILQVIDKLIDHIDLGQGKKLPRFEGDRLIELTAAFGATTSRSKDPKDWEDLSAKKFGYDKLDATTWLNREIYQNLSQRLDTCKGLSLTATASNKDIAIEVARCAELCLFDIDAACKEAVKSIPAPKGHRDSKDPGVF